VNAFLLPDAADKGPSRRFDPASHRTRFMTRGSR